MRTYNFAGSILPTLTLILLFAGGTQALGAQRSSPQRAPSPTGGPAAQKQQSKLNAGMPTIRLSPDIVRRKGPPGEESLGGGNDDCATPQAIAGEGAFFFDNTAATQDGPDHAGCLQFTSTAIDNDVWFCWTAGCDSTVTIETCGQTGIDTKIAAYESCGQASDADLLDCNDDDGCSLQSRITFAALEGNEYKIRIGTFAGANGGSGTFSITTNPSCAPAPNDLCENATVISGDGIFAFDNSTATEDGPDTAGCSFGAGIDRDVWYCWTADCSATVTFETCGQTAVDTKIAVYNGCGTAVDANRIACDDDSCIGLQSSVTFAAVAGNSYKLRVGSFADATGGPGSFTMQSDPSCECTKTVNRMQPGSLIVFPEFDNREGVETLFTVTNTNCSEGINVHYNFVSGDECDPVDFSFACCDVRDDDEDLTPCDTVTRLIRTAGLNFQQGYIYAYARPLELGLRPAVSFNHLVASQLVIDGITGAQYSVMPFVFRASLETDGALTDLDLDNIRDLDGLEYVEAPDQVLIPRFTGQFTGMNAEPAMITRSSDLVLLALSGGRLFNTTVRMTVNNDSEEAVNVQVLFRCWTKRSLESLSNETLNSSLLVDDDPNEILGNFLLPLPQTKMGWLRLDGIIAQSTDPTAIVTDPAFLAVLIETWQSSQHAAIPFERCVQDNGALLPDTVSGDPDN